MEQIDWLREHQPIKVELLHDVIRTRQIHRPFAAQLRHEFRIAVADSLSNQFFRRCRHHRNIDHLPVGRYCRRDADA